MQEFLNMPLDVTRGQVIFNMIFTTVLGLAIGMYYTSWKICREVNAFRRMVGSLDYILHGANKVELAMAYLRLIASLGITLGSAEFNSKLAIMMRVCTEQFDWLMRKADKTPDQKAAWPANALFHGTTKAFENVTGIPALRSTDAWGEADAMLRKHGFRPQKS